MEPSFPYKIPGGYDRLNFCNMVPNLVIRLVKDFELRPEISLAEILSKDLTYLLQILYRVKLLAILGQVSEMGYIGPFIIKTVVNK